MDAPVYTGRWTDYSLGGVSREVITLTVRDGAYLIAALSTFVALVGTSFWSLTAFCIHQWRVRENAQDGFYFQQQALYLNTGTPTAALWEIVKMCWAWRKPRSRSRRISKLKTKSLLIALPAILIFGAFTAAGVFIGNIAGKSYSSNNVLIKAGRCGYPSFNAGTIQGEAAGTQKFINDTLTGRAYATNCYGNNTAMTSFNCGQYTVQALPRSGRNVSCPFGQDVLGDNLCLPGQNTAYELSTPALDSNAVFGINAPPEKRIYITKRLTCAPLHVRNYETSSNTTYPDYFLNLGPVYTGTGKMIQNYTYSYDSRLYKSNVGYQIASLVAGRWLPVTSLRTPMGDVSLHFMMPNSITYLTPVNDIFFKAHSQVRLDSGTIAYKSDDYIYAMGCVDQYQVCNPNTTPASCTILGNLTQTATAMTQIQLNAAQNVTARRLVLALMITNTYLAVSPLGASSLLARNKVFGALESTGLPAEQWKIEVEGWFDTSLAKLQAYVVDYVSNTADLGPYGTVVSMSSGKDNQEDRAADAMCSQQRIRNTGGYQTFSFLGLMIVACLGLAIIVLNWTVEPMVGFYRSFRKSSHRSAREIARVADRTFQLQRMALNQGQENSRWEKVMNDIPVTKSETIFMPPKATRLNGVDDYVYEQHGGPLIQVQHHIPKPDGSEYSGY